MTNINLCLLDVSCPGSNPGWTKWNPRSFIWWVCLVRTNLYTFIGAENTSLELKNTIIIPPSHSKIIYVSVPTAAVMFALVNYGDLTKFSLYFIVLSNESDRSNKIPNNENETLFQKRALNVGSKCCDLISWDCIFQCLISRQIDFWLGLHHSNA